MHFSKTPLEHKNRQLASCSAHFPSTLWGWWG